MGLRGISIMLVVAVASGTSCGPIGPAAPGRGEEAGEAPTIAVTHWTGTSELFMEYPMLEAGRSARFAIHVTDLTTFAPVGSGEAVVTLRAPGGGAAREFRASPSRPGIFGTDVRVEQPGTYLMAVRVEGPDLEDAHDLGEVAVHAGGSLPSLQEEGEEGITFLKEQQWTLEFGTEPVASRLLRSGLTVPAEIRPRSGREASVIAPVAGRLDPSVAPAGPGRRVSRGDVLARVLPRSEDLRDAAAIRAALVEAEQRHDLARKERERAGRLVAARAAPERRLDEAEAALATAAARLEAEQERLARLESLGGGEAVPGSGLFVVRAPLGGVVTASHLSPGASVEEGDALVRIADVDQVDVVGAIPESSAARIGPIAGAELILDGSRVEPLSGRVVLEGHVDPVSRTVAARAPLDNRGLLLPLGHAVRLRLILEGSETMPAVPESSIVDDGGRPVVFVQTAGETFERRPVRLGNREGGYVHAVEGVEPGERVVSQGAYLVRLAAMSTQIPAHGHVH